jgi:hypothetical protein
MSVGLNPGSFSEIIIEIEGDDVKFSIESDGSVCFAAINRKDLLDILNDQNDSGTIDTTSTQRRSSDTTEKPPK